MTPVRARAGLRLLPFGVDLAVLAGLFVVVAIAPTPASSTLLGVSVVHSPSTADSTGVELSIDPPSFWMRTGTNLTLETVWSTGSPLCQVTPAWYQWSLVNHDASGFLNNTTGPSAVFTGDSFDSGEITVEARSGAVVVCGSAESVVNRSVSSQISVVCPLSLSGVEVGPDPLRPGENATLVGTVSGGSPPYSVSVVWTDSSFSTLNLSVPGSFSINHTFAEGTFDPYVVVADSGGDLANRSVAEALSVGLGFLVAVIPTTFVARVGVSSTFAGLTEDPPPGSVPLFACSNATVSPVTPPSPMPNVTLFSCTFHSPGISAVLFGAYPSSFGGPSATAVLYELVVDSPTLLVEPSRILGEVGASAYVRVALSGGAPPFSLRWNLTGNRSVGGELASSDGGGVVAVPLGTAGQYTLAIAVTDALGGIDFDNATLVQADPPLAVEAHAARAYSLNGAVAEVGGVALAGCPPFSWWIAPALSSVNATSSNGVLDQVGTFSWEGVYGEEGNLTLNVGVADGCGATWESVLVVPLVTPLSVSAVVSAELSSPASPLLRVNLTVNNGWPPFFVVINTSTNESWNRSLSANGVFSWSFPTDTTATFEVSVSVMDQLGESNLTRWTVPIPAGAPPPTPPAPSAPANPPNGASSPSVADLLGLAVSLTLPVAAVALWIGMRRRRGRTATQAQTGPDPEATLKQIIEPAEGSERFTVELLAEEAGVPLAVVRSTIDRLVAEGKVKAESGADGEEVLTWSPQSGR